MKYVFQNLAKSISYLTLVFVATSLLSSVGYAQEADAKDINDLPSVEGVADAVRGMFPGVFTPADRLTNGSAVKKPFRSVIEDAKRSTVRVRADGKNVALGGVVGPDGWIVTKASLSNKGRLTVRLDDGREFDARVVGVDRGYDLAMLKVDAKDLIPLKMDDAPDPIAGSWVATIGMDKDPIAVGVVSVAARPIPHRPGILGIQLGDGPDGTVGALVVKVFPNTGAEEAGILINDLVTSINGLAVASREELIKEVRNFSPGDTLKVGVARGDQKLVMPATLTGTNRVLKMNRAEYQNSLGSGLSQRRFGFPKALQHDSVLNASNCGGPLVDLDGRVVGFNLARAGRTESYAIPTAEIRKLLFKLMSGNLPPKLAEEG